MTTREERPSAAVRAAADAARQAYASPRLVEYGSVAKLTQNGSLSGTDGMTMMACL